MENDKHIHILICGERGAGKSTLIDRITADCGLPVYGFKTRRLASREDGFHPIYIHPAGELEAARSYSHENLVGTCDSRTHNVSLEVFDTLGVQLIRAAQPDGVIVMDELGFMEANAKRFTSAVLSALCGDIPVIASVKARFDIPFLDEVRAHPRCRLFTLTPDCRESMYEELLPIVRSWQA